LAAEPVCLFGMDPSRRTENFIRGFASQCVVRGSKGEMGGVFSAGHVYRRRKFEHYDYASPEVIARYIVNWAMDQSVDVPATRQARGKSIGV